MREVRSVSLFVTAVSDSIQLRFADGGHEQDVTVVRHARAAQVRMGESIDHRIRIMISAAAIPAGEPRVGRKLHHAERQHRPGKRMTMAAGADEGVDVIGGSLCTESESQC